MTKYRKGRTSYVLAAGLLSALLATTACQPGAAESPGNSKPSKPSDGQVAPSTPNSANPGGGTPSETGTEQALTDCTSDNLAVSATKEPADSKEARHLLITVQNAGDAKCDLYHYPYVRLGADAQSTVPVIEDSAPDPGVPVTLAPGEEAHAALLVGGGGRDEYEATSLTVTLQGSDPGSTTSKPIDVPMPADTLYADDGQLVTYWTTASGMALDFIMSK